MKEKRIRVGVIAAAGRGTRAYPRTTYIPKPLFRFEKKSLLYRNAEIMFGKLKVRKLYVIVGHLKEQIFEEVDLIRRHFPDREIETSLWTTRGLASDIAVLQNEIGEDFAVILGDEFYHLADHRRLTALWARRKKALAAIACSSVNRISDIRKNYSVELRGNRVVRLIEKPQDPPNRVIGLGSYLFSPAFFEYYDHTPPSGRSGVVELTEVIDRMARESGEVYAENIGGRYFNINSLVDYYAVNYELRSEKFNRYKISLIIPTLNNAATLPDVLGDFKSAVHEIIVVDMGSRDRTTRLAAAARARLIHWKEGTKSGVHSGRAINHALSQASGDILVLVSADGSFRAHDLPKLLEYLKDCDMVIGTRTTRQLIEQGANLSSLYRWLNVAFGKLVEIMWWDQEPRYTDIGCIYRALWRDSYEQMRGDLRADNRTFSLEMMIEILRRHMRCIEIPVSYYRHTGEVTAETLGSRWKYFFSVFRLILSRRFPLFFKKG